MQTTHCIDEIKCFYNLYAYCTLKTINTNEKKKQTSKQEEGELAFMTYDDIYAKPYRPTKVIFIASKLYNYCVGEVIINTY